MTLLKRFQTPLLLALGLCAIIGVGALTGSEQVSFTLTEMLIRMIVVIGLYIFIGNSGIISFGHVGFMCIGAYAAAWAKAA